MQGRETHRGFGAPLLVSAVVLASCGSSVTEPPLDPTAPIQTGSLTYSMAPTPVGSGTVVDYEFTNLSDEPIYFPNCRGKIQAVVEREVGGDWVLAFAGVYPACLGPVIEVAPGQSVEDSVHVARYDPDSNICCGFEEGREPPGIFRVRVVSAVRNYDADRYPFGEDVEERYLVSNRFRIH